jgi:hypothetical protein
MSTGCGSLHDVKENKKKLSLPRPLGIAARHGGHRPAHLPGHRPADLVDKVPLSGVEETKQYS